MTACQSPDKHARCYHCVVPLFGVSPPSQSSVVSYTHAWHLLYCKCYTSVSRCPLACTEIQDFEGMPISAWHVSASCRDEGSTGLLCSTLLVAQVVRHTAPLKSYIKSRTKHQRDSICGGDGYPHFPKGTGDDLESHVMPLSNTYVMCLFRQKHIGDNNPNPPRRDTVRAA